MKTWICLFLGHRFDGWDTVPRDPNGSLGWACCGRCGRVL